jgi:acylphosphatase
MDREGTQGKDSESRATNLERVRVIVSGRVQGVFFRDGARRRARELGVSGWVTNLPDGRVEGLFEGSPDAVREMARWCETGPPTASVGEVSVEQEPATGDLQGFEVR